MSTRSRTGVTTLDCGCKHNDRAWIHECDEHRRAGNQHHIRASQESGRNPRPSAVAQAQLDSEEAEEIDAETMARAAHTKPGESVIDTVDREFPRK